MATTIGDKSAEKVHGLLADLHHKMQKGSITVAQFERFLNKQNPFDVTITENDEVLNVTVDYDRSVASGIKAGKYDWSNSDITDDHYPNSGSGKSDVEIILVHYGKDMSTKNVLKDFDKRNLRPATLQELLAIGEQFPDKQREFPIIALGSVWRNSRGNRYVPCLIGSGSYRGLDLYWIVSDWHDICRFAAVRK